MERTNKFIISAFADESSRELAVQIEVLKKHGIGYIELRGVNGKNIVEHTIEEAKLVKKELDKARIRVSGIASPIGKIDFTDPFEKTVELLKHTLKLAKLLDTKFIRIFSFYMPENEDYDKYRSEIIRRMRIMAELAAEQEVMLVHENEEGIYGEFIDRYYDLLSSTNHPNLGGLFDTANFVYAGEVNCPDAMDRLEKYINYIHIKDIADGKYVVPGTGKGQIKQFLKAMIERGYDGFISLEPHLTAFEGIQRLMRSSDFMPKNSGDGIEKFGLAFDGLKKILDEICEEIGRKIY